MDTLKSQMLVDEPTNTIAYETEYSDGHVEVVVQSMSEQDLYNAIVDAVLG